MQQTVMTISVEHVIDKVVRLVIFEQDPEDGYRKVWDIVEFDAVKTSPRKVAREAIDRCDGIMTRTELVVPEGCPPMPRVTSLVTKLERVILFKIA